METKIQIIRTGYKTYKDLFNRYYERDEKIIINLGLLMAAISISVVISSVELNLWVRFILAANSFFIFLLVIKYIERLDIQVLKSKHSIFVDKITRANLEYLRKQEFIKYFNNYLLAENNLDVKKIVKSFKKLGNSSSNKLWNTFIGVAVALPSAAMAILAFLFSDFDFELKLFVVKILIGSSFVIVYIMFAVFLFLKEKITTRATRDKQIAEWIEEIIRSKE
ncbi:MAG: hypothetical protein O9262_04385 [Cyclobacteriaceae bacterium]|nr:hypothetical protein [Cyclobacteriaceae bacterium]